MNKREALARIPLFSKLEPKYLDRLADLSVPKSFPKDTLLIKEGTVGLGMFAITSGRVEIYKGEGENRNTLNVLDSGTIVGEMALVDEEYPSANVRALELTECLVISRDSFHALLRQEPGAAMAVMSVLAERIRQSQGKIRELERKVSAAVTEAKEPVQDWTDQQGRPREERSRARGDGDERLQERQPGPSRVERELMDSVMGMVGTFMGGVARMVEAVNETACAGGVEAASRGSRRYARAFSRAIDEGVKAFEEVRSARRDRDSDEDRRTSEETPARSGRPREEPPCV